MNLRKKAGFTWVELVIAVALVFVLLLFVLLAPPFGPYRKSPLPRAEGKSGRCRRHWRLTRRTTAATPTTESWKQMAISRNPPTDLMREPPTIRPIMPPRNLVLYRALSGDRNLDRKWDGSGATDSGIGLDGRPLSVPLSEPPTVYYQFPSGMLLPAGGMGTVTGIVDPFGNLLRLFDRPAGRHRGRCQTAHARLQPDL